MAPASIFIRIHSLIIIKNSFINIKNSIIAVGKNVRYRLVASVSRDGPTGAVLRLECSIDFISGSVGHQQNIFRLFYHCQRFF